MQATPRTSLPAWKALAAHQRDMAGLHMKDLFARDPGRAERFSVQHEGYFLDYSKNNVTDETIRLLCDLARGCGLEEWRAALFGGEAVNSTEGRAALHTALRGSGRDSVAVDGVPVKGEIEAVLARMEHFVQRCDEDGRYSDIVTIGIGGSDIGPHLVCEALAPFARAGRRMHFLSNVDPSHITEIMRELEPAGTLFIVSSKSFTTQETMTNAASAREWIVMHLGEDAVKDHFVCVTGEVDRALAFGAQTSHIFPLWDWVGGRYSLWSAIGLPIALSAGFENFKALLAGAHSADEHFLSAPLEKNIPVLLGMIGVWYRNFWDYGAYAVLPYDHYLAMLPIYIRQIEMESNGKSVDRNGARVDYQTVPAIFGEVGTNGQHAFHQMLHQGTQVVPCDFIVAARSQNPLGDHHDKLVANAVAQAQALMRGEDNRDEPHRHFEGNRPSNFVLLGALDPYSLGMMLAFYEHKVFVQGVIWNLNSFDQFGVELGKILTKDILAGLGGRTDGAFDSSTKLIMEKIRRGQ